LPLRHQGTKRDMSRADSGDRIQSSEARRKLIFAVF